MQGFLGSRGDVEELDVGSGQIQGVPHHPVLHEDSGSSLLASPVTDHGHGHGHDNGNGDGNGHGHGYNHTEATVSSVK